MKNTFLFKSLTLFCLVSQTFNGFGQTKFNSLEIGLGSSYYFGDLAPYEDMALGFVNSPSFNFSLGYTQVINDRIEAVANLSFARIKGDDFTFAKRNIQAYNQQFLRNLHFRNDIKELSFRLRYNFNPNNIQTDFKRPKFNYYGTLGLAVFGHNPEAHSPGSIDKSRNWIYLRDKNTSGQSLFNRSYSLVQLAVPLGFGVRYKIGKRLDLNLESVFRLTTTDYLDDVGNTRYLSEALFQGSEEAYALHNRSLEPISGSGDSRVGILNSYFDNRLTWDENVSRNVGTQRGFNKFMGKVDSYSLLTFSLCYWLNDNVK